MPLLSAYGLRTANGPGQHEALGRYLRAALDKPPADKAASAFDRLRRALNQDRYEAKPVGAAAAEKAEQVACELFDAAMARGCSPLSFDELKAKPRSSHCSMARHTSTCRSRRILH